MSDNKDLMTSWWDAQQTLFSSWSEMFTKTQPNTMNDIFSKQMEMFGMKNWGLNTGTANFYQDWLAKSNQGFQEFLKWVPNSVGKDTMEKMVQAGDVYTKLYSFWSNMAANMPGQGEVEKWQDFGKTMIQNYNQVLDGFFGVNLPDPVKMMMKSPGEVCGLYQQTCMSLADPWLESSDELKELFAKALKGDRDAYSDFMRIWYETYAETTGKALNMPMFGLSRESVEKMMKGLDSYIKFITASNKFSTSLYTVGYNVMENLMKNVAQMAEKGDAPESFKDFYKMWWQTNEQAYFELFQSEDFSRMMGDVVDAWLSFKKQNDDVLVEIISSNLPIPTDREMDSLAKSVQQLKRNMWEQTKKIKELQEKIEELTAKGGGEL
ncbi:MAG: hypothetical protein KGZ63_11635 [Clostridiales bacterium]|jgi:class III poly(R)-hydroxyalkanoic acid synthase PhaE subunit|nr:hypothetical protein [Clostridiales bacterium]